MCAQGWKELFFKDLRKGKKVVFKRSHVKGKLTKLSEFALVELLKYIYIAKVHFRHYSCRLEFLSRNCKTSRTERRTKIEKEEGEKEEKKSMMKRFPHIRQKEGGGGAGGEGEGHHWQIDFGDSIVGIASWLELSFSPAFPRSFDCWE